MPRPPCEAQGILWALKHTINFMVKKDNRQEFEVWQAIAHTCPQDVTKYVPWCDVFIQQH